MSLACGNGADHLLLCVAISFKATMWKEPWLHLVAWHSKGKKIAVFTRKSSRFLTLGYFHFSRVPNLNYLSKTVPTRRNKKKTRFLSTKWADPCQRHLQNHICVNLDLPTNNGRKYKKNLNCDSITDVTRPIRMTHHVSSVIIVENVPTLLELWTGLPVCEAGMLSRPRTSRGDEHLLRVFP